MNFKYSEKATEIIRQYSREEAIRLGNEYIAPEHLFLAILRDGDNPAVNMMASLTLNLTEIKEKIEDRIKNERIIKPGIDTFPLKEATVRILRLAELSSKEMKSEEIDAVHILLGILRQRENFAAEMLETKNFTYDIAKDLLADEQLNEIRNELPDDDDDSDDMGGSSAAASSNPKSNSNTPVLDNFGVDLTKAAEEGKLDPIVGRDIEIERLVQILSRRKKNNPILIGEPGVGKSAIAEGLALRIIQKKVSRILFDKRIVTLDLASIVAGTKYRGQFEERMKSILNELAKTDNVILFIDEIHTIVGAGGASGSLDAANMLKPALARGEIQCIGATTLDEYRQHIEKDGALERRFQKIMVNPTTIDETVQILNNIKSRYEDHHNVIYTNDAIEACVHLTNRYISDRHLPDKAIDALDETGSRVHISNINVPKRIEDLEKLIEEIKNEKVSAVKQQKFEVAAEFRDKEQKLIKELAAEKKRWQTELEENRVEVNVDHVEKVVAMMTGIPVQRIAQAEGSRLLKMNEEMQGKVVGQAEAIAKIVKAIQRNRAGLKDPSKPIGSFIFLGPTGVGKTQLAKILAEYLFDTSDALIRIDMSEYMEKFSVSRLVGAPPGYIGYEEGGQLTEKVRRKPYAIVLLDEIEKAHPDVFHILLQVLDEGTLTDSLGRKVDFKNTIVIMTSNIGTRELKEFGRSVGFSATAAQTNDDYAKSVIQKALKKAFAPEFLNRIDDVILFNSLSREHIHKIIDIELKGLYSRVAQLGYTLTISEEAKDFLSEKGFDEKFGARPLKRAIQKYLEDEMAEVIIQAQVMEGDTIAVELDKEKDEIKISIRSVKVIENTKQGELPETGTTAQE